MRSLALLGRTESHSCMGTKAPMTKKKVMQLARALIAALIDEFINFLSSLID